MAISETYTNYEIVVKNKDTGKTQIYEIQLFCNMYEITEKIGKTIVDMAEKYNNRPINYNGNIRDCY